MSTNNDFSNSLGDLKKNIEYLIGMERAEGNLEPLTAEYISRVLKVPVEEVEECIEGDGNVISYLNFTLHIKGRI